MKDTLIKGTRILEASALDRLFDALDERGYDCVGPTLRDGAIVYDRLTRAADLPQGWTDEHEAGRYRLKRRNDDAYFGYVVGPHSFKRYLFPPERRLWQLTQDGKRFTRTDEQTAAPKHAFIGVRGCELAAIGVQTRVLTGGQSVDPSYQQRRHNALIVAVNCTQSGATCFCSSMGTGPEARGEFDLCLTEILEPAHVFLIAAGSAEGQEIVAELPTTSADRDTEFSARKQVQAAGENQSRAMDTDGLRELLRRNADSPRWEAIAERCLSCANCTMACPTCFCSAIEDTVDLSGQVAERWQRWDSCFNTGFSYFSGGDLRASTASRYRQWITHKLSTWHDQFGHSGCVGCGRCITWCPVGIDITEEVRNLRQDEKP